MSVVKWIDRMSDQTDKIVKVIVFLIVMSMIIAISLQIMCRVFFNSLTWSEELSRYLLVWATFLGATMAYKRGMHIAVTFVVDAVPASIGKIIRVLSILLSILFFAIAIIFGMKYMSMQIFQVSAALRVPMKFVYTVMPLSFMIMTIHACAALLRELDFGKRGAE